MAKTLGIDLGTTNSAMATMEGGEAKIIENKEGGRTTPSVVAVSKSGELLVGVLAKRQQIVNPENTIFSIKRLIGRRFSDPEVQKDIKNLPYKVRESDSGSCEVQMGDKWYKPEEISAKILQKLKIDAEERLGEKITDVVITCPAYFDDSQRKATKAAGEIAGFNVLRVINEPTAAALAYGFDKKKDEKILVYDFGGGTFDISILEVSEDTIEVKATGGDNHLGGDDLDQKIIDWLTEQFKKDEGIDLTKDPLALQRLKEAAEKAKIELSSTMETDINLPFITSDASGPKHLNYKLLRSQFEQMVKPYIDKSIDLVKKTLNDAKLSPNDINEIVLVGGQTRMPAIQNALKEMFGKEPNKSINPDEVVAIGAAIQAAIIKGDVKSVLLLDVTPLSLGIETLGGVNTILIPKNTTIPTKKSQVFTTAADNQTSVEIHIVQGERPMAKDNKSLGRFILEGIPPAPRGVPQIEVTFDIDSNGILSVTAQDKASGKSQSIRIEGATGLSKDEIERMKKEAESHLEEDKKKKELIEAKNIAENIIYTAEKTIKDNADKITNEEKSEIESKIKDLRDAQNSDDVQVIKAKTDDLSKTLSRIGERLYKQAGASSQPEGQNGEGQNQQQDGNNQGGSQENGENTENKEDEKK